MVPKPDLSHHIQALNIHLERMAGQFNDLSTILLQERSLIKSRQTDQLESINRMVELALEGIHDSDIRRQEITQLLAQAVNLPSDGVSLMDLDRQLGGATGFIPLRDQLKKAIQQANNLNRENRAIVTGIQTATEALLGIFKKSAQTGQSYNRLGGKSAGHSLNLYSKNSNSRGLPLPLPWLLNF